MLKKNLKPKRKALFSQELTPKIKKDLSKPVATLFRLAKYHQDEEMFLNHEKMAV